METSQTRQIPFAHHVRTKSFNRAYHRFFARELSKAYREIIPEENIASYRHGRAWQTVRWQPGSEGEMNAHSTEDATDFATITGGELGELRDLVNRVVEKAKTQFMEQMYKKLGEVTEATGNVVHSEKGESRTVAFLDMLLKIEFGIKRNGELSLPEIHVSESLMREFMRDLENEDEEFERIVNEVIKQKSEKARAEELQRRQRFPGLRNLR